MAHLETTAFVNVESEQRLGASSKDLEDPFSIITAKRALSSVFLLQLLVHNLPRLFEPGSTTFSEPGSSNEKRRSEEKRNRTS